MTEPEADPVLAWLDRHRAGQRPPVAVLAELCEEQIKRLVRPRLPSFPLVRREEQTTDVSNETFVRLSRALKDIAPATPLELNRLIAVIVRRVLLDWTKAIRRRKKHIVPLDGDPACVPEDSDHSVDADLMTAFHEYVEALPADEKVLFDLLYYRGLSTAAAADCLGIPRTTLKRRWVKARVRLSERFGLDPTEH
jgi:RNA polymerase sigma factor (sigma-70 family)